MYPSSTEAALRKYGDPHYHAGGELRGREYDERRIDRLEECCPDREPLRILEVGCGTGGFAKHVLRRGHDITAIEPGVRFDDAREVLGERAKRETWEEHLGSVEPYRYDVIVAWEVIEHLPQPSQFVNAAADVLRDGALLALSTPNAMSWSVSTLRKRDPMLTPDEHLQLFTAEGLAALLSERFECNGEYFGRLYSHEVMSGMRRLVGSSLPRPLARVAAGVTSLIARSRFGLGVEVYAIRQAHI